MNETKMARIEKFNTSLKFLRDRADRALKVAQALDPDGAELAALKQILGNVAHGSATAADAFERKLASGWQPQRAAAVAAPLAVGDKVHIRDRFAKSFDGQLTTKDDLIVTRVVGKRIYAKLETEDGSMSFSLARNQVRRAGESQATAEAAEKIDELLEPGSDVEDEERDSDVDDEEGEEDEDAA